MDTGQPIPQSPPSNLKDGPAPNNIIPANSSPTIRFHPITLVIRELELGKSLLSIGILITMVVLISNNDSKKIHTTFAYLMVSGISIGSMAIWNGIVLRKTFPRSAKAVEQLGSWRLFVHGSSEREVRQDFPLFSSRVIRVKESPPSHVLNP